MPLSGGTVILFVGMPPRLLTGIAVMPAALAAGFHDSGLPEIGLPESGFPDQYCRNRNPRN